MGYIISYHGADSVKIPTVPRRSRMLSLTLGFFLAFLLLTRLFWPAGSAKLRQFLIPGDPDVTGHAAALLVEELRTGEPAGEAIKAFCSEILSYADYPD